ncbi:MAG TPA: 2-oxo-4-hydroxy-4-carboxy-5-ureidoimidazoline decarboxylase [Chthoniobacterales bacterium]|jgi:2-oxo-4-hydroxy-4-carboxy-5-ureidoimidazoline decarboxylase
MTVAELNEASEDDFCAALDGIWEHSPWIVKAAAAARPFADVESLDAAMWAAVEAAGRDDQLALLRAHPDLAGKLVLAGGLTRESASEQASAGLDRLTKSEFKAFNAWNERYRQRFGFPFILCVRGNNKNAIRAAFRQRLSQPLAVEFATALAEVRKIADLRLRDRITA